MLLFINILWVCQYIYDVRYVYIIKVFEMYF